MRVVFMGTPDFSVGTLRELAKAGHEIAGVISQQIGRASCRERV